MWRVLQLLQLHKVSLNLTQLTQSNLNNNSILLYTQNDCTTTLACLSVWQQQRNNEHIYFCTDSTRTTRLLASSSPMLYTKPALKRVPGIAGQCMTQLNDLAVPWTQTKNSVCLWCVRFAQALFRKTDMVGLVGMVVAEPFLFLPDEICWCLFF